MIYTKQSEDEDVSQIFVERLEQDITRIYKKCGKVKMTITPNQQRKFQKAITCWICQGKFDKNDKKLKPVRDHCHFTGKYRETCKNLRDISGADLQCNLQFRKPKFTPVFFHNLAGYDAHLFVRNLGKTEGEIKCIPNNEKKYISFSKEIVVDTYLNKKKEEKEVKHELRFIDSLKFMPSSLSKLTSNLEKNQFRNLQSMYEGEQLELLKCKGVYPYEYVDSLDRLAELQLPPKETFNSKLNDEHISNEDYEHAQKVWEAFDCKTLKDYHDLYLKSDVILLADVFETFRDHCMTNYELDLAWYYTTPGLAWDAALKVTKVELELLSDPDMLLMFEKGVWGGVSSIMHECTRFPGVGSLSAT